MPRLPRMTGRNVTDFIDLVFQAIDFICYLMGGQLGLTT
jgi:hypothetical protein